MRWMMGAAVSALTMAIAATGPNASAEKLGQAALEERAKKARELVATLTDRLRLELSQATKTGVATAVAQCQTISPELSPIPEPGGFEVQRTSLRLRNPENAPDDWERGVLQTFQARVASGSDPARLEHFEVVMTAEGDKLFRYMRGIPVGEICLACHGTDLKQDVKAELTRYYPDDKATGYKLGELRGAFSLIQLIEE